MKRELISCAGLLSVAGFSSLLTLFLPKVERGTVTVVHTFSPREETVTVVHIPHQPTGGDCHRCAHSSTHGRRLSPLCTPGYSREENVTVVHTPGIAGGECHRCAHSGYSRERSIHRCAHPGYSRERYTPLYTPGIAGRELYTPLYTPGIAGRGIHPVIHPFIHPGIKQA